MNDYNKDYSADKANNDLQSIFDLLDTKDFIDSLPTAKKGN